MDTETVTRRWSTPPRDRRHLDRLNDEAGEALRLTSAGAQKVIALALGQSEGWVSKQIRGDRTGALQRMHQVLDRLAAAARRRPGTIDPSMPVVAQLRMLVQAMTPWEGVELRRFLAVSLTKETEHQAGEDVAQMPLVRLLATLPDDPTPAEAAEAEAIVSAWMEAAMREFGSQLSALVGAAVLRERLRELAHVH